MAKKELEKFDLGAEILDLIKQARAEGNLDARVSCLRMAVDLVIAGATGRPPRREPDPRDD